MTDHISPAKSNANEVNYHLDEEARFRIDNYDEAPGFCSFLPGVAGEDGVPLWCMYVNRAQAVVAFGMTGKDQAVAEFLPATWAYQLVGVQGFRTFCKVDGNYYEPFQRDPASMALDYTRAMWIEADRICLEEENASLGLTFRVEYLGAVNRTLPALVRRLTVTNTGDQSRSLQILDGLPVILPAGFTDIAIKKMRHIQEAYALVRRLDNGVPYYAPKVTGHDEAEVVEVKEGNFYAAWQLVGDTMQSIEPIVDPHVVFGGASDLITPRKFIRNDTLDRDAQVWENRLPCALVPMDATLAPGESVTLQAVTGAAQNDSMVAPFLKDFAVPNGFDAVARESATLMDEVTQPAMMVSANPILDQYTKQNYLDNVLRGGIPLMLPSKNGPMPLHLYARRHGDLERDYNDFVLAEHPLADGAGNYRDVCQNQRYDNWFYKDLYDQEIRMFCCLLQADGFNPLGITGFRWQLPKGVKAEDLCPDTTVEARKAFCKIFEQPFGPGLLLGWADQNQVSIDDRNTWLNTLLGECETVLVAGGHHGGYWVDHWIYIVDLLDAFVGVFPDKVQSMLTEVADITWFDEGAYVVPRKDKHMLRPTGPLQLNAVIGVDVTTESLAPVTALGKLCTLLAVKAVSLDYEGKGIDMEGGRPGWNDSMNGLPGIFGSSTCETAASARLAAWLLAELGEVPDTEFPTEVADFIDEVCGDLSNTTYDWDRAATIRENYRKQVRFEASGETRPVSGETLIELLKGVVSRMQTAVDASVAPDTQLMHTYYRATPVDPKIQKNDDGSERLDPATGSPLLTIDKLEQIPLALFLEGQVHHLRLLGDDQETARKVYQSVRSSGLFDEELQMYKLNECLAEMPEEIGRARTFSRGWFENESVWMHMEYKYLLELLRAGLYEEFFTDAQTMLVPFMDPAKYGRSTLENSSFIACSACPDPNARGRGFIARLTGSTAEFIHIWILMTAGARPFTHRDGALKFQLKPVLPADWFTTEEKTISWNGKEETIPANAFTCAFLGDMLLVYHNDERKDTFGKDAVQPVRYGLDGETPVKTAALDHETVLRIRDRKCIRLDVWLGS
jgi:hypothetical protein